MALNILYVLKKLKLKKHGNVCKNHGYYYTEMPIENNKILKYHHGDKSMKVLLSFYADLEFLLEKIDTCYNILKSHQVLPVFSVRAKRQNFKFILLLKKANYSYKYMDS